MRVLDSIVVSALLFGAGACQGPPPADAQSSAAIRSANTSQTSVSVFTTSESIAAGALAPIAGTAISYTMVGGGGGGAAMDYAGPVSGGLSAKPVSGTFKIESNNLAIYVGGGGGGAGTWGARGSRLHRGRRRRPERRWQAGHRRCP